MPPAALCILFITCLAPASGDVGSAQSIYLTYNKLYSDILSRPAIARKLPPCLENCNKSLNPIHLSLLIMDVHEIDEMNQVMTLDVYMDVWWPYQEAVWNMSDYDDIGVIQIDSKTVWTPEIFIALGKEDSFLLEYDNQIDLVNSGYGTYEKHQYLSFMCDVDFDYYPFDTQKCSVGFYHCSRPYFPMEIDDLNFNLSTIYNRTGEWILEKIDHAFFDGNKDSFPEGIRYYIFTVRRQSTYYVITIIFPMVLTSVMIPLVFLIPAQTGEKISYLVAIFTSTAIFLHYILDVMPRSLCRLPYLAILLIEVLMEGFLAMLASLLVVNFYKKEMAWTEQTSTETCEENEKLPPYADQKIQPNTENQTKCCDGSDVLNYEVRNSGGLRLTSRWMDMIFFSIFMSGQILFLIFLFIGTNWLSGESDSSGTLFSDI